jgi:tetratricopeptide (TPR) repeat protein
VLAKPKKNNCDTSQQSSSLTKKTVNWRWILGTFSLVAASLLLVKPYQILGKTPTEKLPKTAPEPTVTTLPVPELSMGQKASAFLEQEESKFVSWLMAEIPHTDFALSAVSSIYERQGNSTKAMELWENLLERNPNRPYVYYGMGKIAKKKGDNQEAIRCWRKALEINPKLPRVRLEIGESLMSLGKNAEAIKEIEEEIKASPRGPLSHFGYYLLGQAYLQLEEYEKARESFEKSIEINPENAFAAKSNYGLARLYAKLKQRDKAATYLALYRKQINKSRSDMLSANPHNSVFFASKNLAQLYTETYKFCRVKGNIKKAEESFQNAKKVFQHLIFLTPDWSTGYRDLSVLYVGTRRQLPQAKELAQKAVELEPRADNYLALSRACYANGDKPNALRAAERAVELMPEKVEYRRMYEFLKRGN